MHKGNLIPKVLESMKITTGLHRDVDFYVFKQFEFIVSIGLITFTMEYINHERCKGLNAVFSFLLLSAIVQMRDRH